MSLNMPMEKDVITSFHIFSHLFTSCHILSHLVTSCHILSHFVTLFICEPHLWSRSRGAGGAVVDVPGIKNFALKIFTFYHFKVSFFMGGYGWRGCCGPRGDPPNKNIFRGIR